MGAVFEKALDLVDASFAVWLLPFFKSSFAFAEPPFAWNGSGLVLEFVETELFMGDIADVVFNAPLGYMGSPFSRFSLGSGDNWVAP